MMVVKVSLHITTGETHRSICLCNRGDLNVLLSQNVVGLMIPSEVIVKCDAADGHVRMLEFKPFFSYWKGSISESEELLLIQGQVPFAIHRAFIFSRHPQRIYWADLHAESTEQAPVMSIEYSLA